MQTKHRSMYLLISALCDIVMLDPPRTREEEEEEEEDEFIT